MDEIDVTNATITKSEDGQNVGVINIEARIKNAERANLVPQARFDAKLKVTFSTDRHNN